MRKTTYYLLFIIIAIFVHSIQKNHDRQINSPSTKIEDFKYLPSGKFLKGAALSFDEVLADLLWIKAIGYFGSHYRTDKKFPWLERILDVTTTLDPYFDDPYEFGGIILAAELGDIDASTALLKKGMKNVPKHHKRYWYLPFFTAFNYMYYKGDYATAAHYLKIAASFPQRPAYLPLLVARLYANTDDPAVAIPFLEKMMERAATPEMKEKLQQRIKEIILKKHIHVLETARDKYKKLAGKYPETLDELVRKGLISSIPVEPLGGHYYISAADHLIKTSSKVDDMTVHIKSKPAAKTKKKNVPFMLREHN